MNLEFFTYGDAKKPVIFFIHGWPDDSSLWIPHMPTLSKDYYCVCITLPGYSKGTPSDFSAWGEPFDSVVDRIFNTMKSVLASRPSGATTKVGPYLVGHDWGAIMSYHLLHRHPDFITKAITLDIGGHIEKFSGVYATIMILFYQLYLVGCYFMPTFLGSFFSKLLTLAFGCPQHGQVITNKMNYTYFYLWKGIVTNKPLPYQRRYTATTPICYIYGKNKTFQFHSNKWR
eukprot:PhF_6_TR42763/c0_g1_i5/m.64678